MAAAKNPYKKNIDHIPVMEQQKNINRKQHRY